MNELNRLRIRTCIWFAWTAPALCSITITVCHGVRLSGSNIYFTEAVVDQN